VAIDYSRKVVGWLSLGSLPSGTRVMDAVAPPRPVLTAWDLSTSGRPVVVGTAYRTIGLEAHIDMRWKNTNPQDAPSGCCSMGLPQMGTVNPRPRKAELLLSIEPLLSRRVLSRSAPTLPEIA
jgi:hypothetical protein